jgi:hypothetical protein
LAPSTINIRRSTKEDKNIKTRMIRILGRENIETQKKEADEKEKRNRGKVINERYLTRGLIKIY